MFFIVAGHFLGQSGAILADAGMANFVFNTIFGQGSRIAVNGFLILGCYFMAGSTFRGERFLKLWLQEFFYTFVLTMAMFFITPGQVSVTAIGWSMLPIMGWNHNHWYITVYLVLILLSPFLNKLFELEQPKIKRFLIIATICGAALNSLYNREDGYFGCVAWFIYIFLLMGYYKLYLKEKVRGKYIWLCLGVVGYLLLAFAAMMPQLMEVQGILARISNLANNFLGDIKTLPNLFVAFCIFVFFSKLEMGSVKWINFFSTSTLAVYIVHQTEAFYPFLWERVFKASAFYTRAVWPLYSLGCIAALFVIVTLIDKIRVSLLEKNILKLEVIKRLISKLDRNI